MDIENIHTILIEAGLPSNINALKNPTEDFVVNLLEAFLTKFNIDVKCIEKSTMEQQSVMLSCEDSDILEVIAGIINLHVVMVQIYERIYLKDFCITDISNPGPKRLRRQLHYLTNFIVYDTNKEGDIRHRINEIEKRAPILQDLTNKRNAIQEAMSEKALHVGDQLSVKEKYLAEIAKLETKIETNSKHYYELLGRKTLAQENKQQAIEKCGFYKTETLKLSEKIGKLQSEIVKSPEECEIDLRERKEQCRLKEKQRDIMQEQFQEKKQLLEQKEKGLILMQKLLDTCSNIKDTNRQLREANIKADTEKKEVENLKALHANTELKLAGQSKEYKESEMDEVHIQQEERLASLRSLHPKLLNDKKSAKIKLEQEEVHHNEICLQRDKIQNDVKKAEEEIVLVNRNFQELYDTEINAEKDLRRIWTAVLDD